jgi:hypothetical protein
MDAGTRSGAARGFASVVFLDHGVAYESFKRDFADQPALLAGASPSVLPESSASS